MMKKICFDGSLRLVNCCLNFFFQMQVLLSLFQLTMNWLVMIFEIKNVFLLVYVEVAIALRPLLFLLY